MGERNVAFAERHGRCDMRNLDEFEVGGRGGYGGEVGGGGGGELMQEQKLACVPSISKVETKGRSNLGLLRIAFPDAKLLVLHLETT